MDYRMDSDMIEIDIMKMVFNGLKQQYIRMSDRERDDYTKYSDTTLANAYTVVTTIKGLQLSFINKIPRDLKRDLYDAINTTKRVERKIVKEIKSRGY